MDAKRIKIDRKRILAREVEGETVILDLDRQTYIAGSRSVSVLWPLLERGTSSAELLEALLERYGAERDLIARDLDHFLADLADRGLLVGSGELRS